MIHLDEPIKAEKVQSDSGSATYDVMVSVRMPRSLLKKLQELVEKNHFLDLSEEVRSIVRQKWIEAQNPQLFEIKKLREDIGSEIRKKTEEKIQNEITKELQKIREQLRRGGLQ